MRVARDMAGIAICFLAIVPVAVPFHVPFIPSYSTSTLHRRASAPQTAIRHKSSCCGAATTSTSTTTAATAASHEEVAACMEAVVGKNKTLDELSRSDLQGLCKRLKIRAVGKTSELISRLETARGGGEKDVAVAAPGTDHNLHDDEHLPQSDVLLESGGVLFLPSVDGASDGDAGEPVEASGHGEIDKRNDGCGEERTAVTPDLPTLDQVRPFFEKLSEDQWTQVEQLGLLLAEWNSRVNLISRKDIGNVMRNHVVPCLAMAKALGLEDGVEVLDVGTGGGLPGLPLAICYPDVHFTLIDGKGKKIAAVQDMVDRLGLENVRAFHVRAEDVYETFDFIIGRAVTSLPKFVGFVEKNLRRTPAHRLERKERARELAHQEKGGLVRGPSPGGEVFLGNGVLYMRGEASQEELSELGTNPATVISLQRMLSEGKQAGGERVVDSSSDCAGVRDDHDEATGAQDTGDDDGDVSSKGYSKLFHFTSEDIWNRVPAATAIDRI